MTKKNLQEITGHTRMICLLGSPVAHSLSPQMHNLAFETLGLDYRYLAFDVQPAQLSAVVEAFRAMKVRGMNLTMPLKNDIVPLCDRLSPAAEISGAVNTVVFEEDGSLSGHTTDGAGFLRALREDHIDWKGKKLTLFGTGGAGTAILVQAALDGAAEISVFSRFSSRFIDRTRRVVAQLNERTGCRVKLYDYEDSRIRQELGDSALLVNASNVGMAPNVEGCLVKEKSWLPEGLTVTDVIYNPRETRLLQLAREQGLKTMNGMYMLLYQGAESFRLWTGREMPAELVKERYFSLAD